MWNTMPELVKMRCKTVKKPLACLFLIILLANACSDNEAKKANYKRNHSPAQEVISNSTHEISSDGLTNDSASDGEKIGYKKEAHDEVRIAFGEQLEKDYIDKTSQIDAKKLFRNYCANCHGIKGNLQLNGAKDLTKIQSSIASNITQIYYGKGLMTPFQKVLNDEEIVVLARYVHSLSK